MTSIVEHFRLHRTLLLAIGLWPYNQSKFIELQFSLFFAVPNSFVIFQLISFITSDYTLDLVIKILSTIFFFLFCEVHHISFWINAYTVKCFVERLQYISCELKDENEIAIIKKYGNRGEYITIIITLLVVCCLIIITILPFLPWILGTFLLANESRPLHNTLIVTEYFVDKETNFYLIILHTYASMYIGTTALVGGGLMLIAYLKHICGLFSIASYRMRQTIMLNIHEEANRKNEMEMNKKLRHAVDIHRTAIELSEFFTSSFNTTYFCLIVVGVICLVLNLCQVLRSAVLLGNIEEVILHLIFAFAMVLYVFLANYIGEEIIKQYNNMFSIAYNIEWYTAPICIQRLILFLLQRSCKAYGLKIAGLFIASLECFASIIAASISYFTVIYSTQK
ncbi:ObirOr5-9E57 [Ooceraea biroi]|uniref:Odorant receptor n=1 Tax=Ooceraea biroi TaxID=2015173 RepID=A0A3L8DZ08_OOCBI|nr:putative odorant receptor 92a isoform X2 [Ooceraea biroi]RLU25586.1 ObirOr5-9E57 [Ooceraea biroi]